MIKIPKFPPSFCHICGKVPGDFYIVFPCPLCGVKVEVGICRECLEKLEGEIKEILEDNQVS